MLNTFKAQMSGAVCISSSVCVLARIADRRLPVWRLGNLFCPEGQLLEVVAAIRTPIHYY
eukprot:3068306-Pyramimonas_sp.AAC.1